MTERSLRVLLIEDDPDDFLIAQELLGEMETLKVDVEWAPTYEEGLEAVRACRHDLFIIDYFLGPQVGTEILREAIRVNCRAPMIVLTGRPSQEVDIQTMHFGAAEFLVKGWLDAPGLERAIRHALERKRFEEEQRLLAEAGKLLGGLLDLDTTLRSIARLLVPAMSDSCVIDIPDSQGRLERLVAVSSDPDRESVLHELRRRFPLSERSAHPVRKVMETGESLFVPEVTAEMMRPLGEDPEELEMLERLRPTSCMLVPIRIRERPLGVVSLGTYESRRRFDERDLDLAQEIGRRAAVAVDNARLYREAQEAEEQIRRHASRLQVLSEASKLFTEARLEREAVLNSMIELVASTIGDLAVARLLSEDGQWLTPVARWHGDLHGGSKNGLDLSPEPVNATEGIFGSVVGTGTSVLIPHVSDEAELAAHGLAPGHPDRFGGGQSILIVPLRVHNRVIGTLELTRHRSDDPYSHEDQVLVQELADRAGQAFDNARLYEEAQRALQARDEVTAIVSHDLRDPLHTIQLSALLLADVDLQAEQRRIQCEIIERAANRAERLIQDLLDVARMEAGKFSVEPSETLLRPLIEETCDMLRSRVSSQSVALSCDVPPDLPILMADRHRVLQLLSNLLGNAIKFTPEGGRIEIGGDTHGDEVRLWVRNTGDGIRPDQLPHLFDRFWQARRASRAGAGLGLAICKGIVEAHGGRMWAESEVGSHATFFFTLPIQRGMEAHSGISPKPTEPQPSR